MKFTKNQIDKLNIELTLQIEAADYAENERKKLAECRRKADFKGFRKGNAPASLVKKVYGGEVLANVINEAIGKGLQQFIEQEKLHILGEPLASANQPEIDWTSGNDFTFVFDLGLYPEVNVEVAAEDEVPSYTVTVSAKEKADFVEQLKKYYDAQSKKESEGEQEESEEKKTDEQIEKEASDRLKENYKAEAEWRLTKDIKNFYIAKSGVEIPEEFLKRWLLQANEGKVTAEQMETEFPAFVEDFKWQLVRGYLMKKLEFQITTDDLHEAAKSYISYQYAMYGLSNLPEDIVSEAVVNMLKDQQQVDRLAEQVEDKKVIEHIKTIISIKSKKISSEKFKELN